MGKQRRGKKQKAIFLFLFTFSPLVAIYKTGSTGTGLPLFCSER
jgi:hypothetical protein